MSNALLDTISKHLMLNADIVDDLGLERGRTGIVLFFYEYSRFKGCTICEKFADELMDSLLDGIENYQFDYRKNICGIGLGFAYLIKNGYIESTDKLMNDFDNQIINKIYNNESIDNGFKGVAYYILSRFDTTANIISLDYIRKLHKKFVDLCKKKDDIELLFLKEQLGYLLNGKKIAKISFLSKYLDKISYDETSFFCFSSHGISGLAGVGLKIMQNIAKSNDNKLKLIKHIKPSIVIFTQSTKGAIYGIGTYIENLTQCLKNSNYGLEFIELSSYESDIKSIYTEGYRKIIIPNIYKKNILTDENYRKYYYRNLTFLLKIFFLQNSFYIFHLNYMHNGYLAKWLKKIFHCKIVLTIHYTNWSFELLGDYKKLRTITKKTSEHLNFVEQKIQDSVKMDKTLVSVCDHLICVAQHTSNYLEEILAVEKTKITVLSHGISDQYVNNQNLQTKIKEKYYISRKTKVILFAGRLDEIKGIVFLIRAFKKVLQNNHTSVHLIIVGDGNFHDLINESKDICSKISFTGKIERDQLYELYSIAYIGVVCSIHEEFGYVALEMMMHGIPLIVTQTSGLDEMIDNEITGLKIPVIVENGKRTVDVEILSEKIEYLLNNPQVGNKLSQNERKHYLENYQFTSFRDKMLNFYGNI